MAEFSEVMKQLARMTNACNGKCDECPLDSAALCAGPWCFENAEGIAEAERIIMQWAAEHPEPVYPTWREWLIKNGLIDFKPDFRALSYNPSLPLQENSVIECLNVKASEPIPADIAKSLGLEPKEE